MYHSPSGGSRATVEATLSTVYNNFPSTKPLIQTSLSYLLITHLHFFSMLFSFPIYILGRLLLVSATYTSLCHVMCKGKKSLPMGTPEINAPRTKVCLSQIKKIQERLEVNLHI